MPRGNLLRHQRRRERFSSLSSNFALEVDAVADVGLPLRFDFSTEIAFDVKEENGIVSNAIVGANGGFEPVVVRIVREADGCRIIGSGGERSIDVAAEVTCTGNANISLTAILRSFDTGVEAFASAL